MARIEINALIKDAVADAMSIVKRAKTVCANYPNPFNSKTTKVSGKKLSKPVIRKAKNKKSSLKITASLQERSKRRRVVAQQLYNVMESDPEGEAHPEGGTHTKAGDSLVEGDALVETQTEQQKADVAVANKDPRGELVAKRKSTRRQLVADILGLKKKAAVKCPDCGGNCGDNGFCPNCRKVTVESGNNSNSDKGREGKEARRRLRHKKVAQIAKERSEELAEKTLEVIEEENSEKLQKESFDKEQVEARTKTRKKILSELKTKGEIDAETKSYYQELWGGIDPEAKQFANDLTSDFASFKKKSSLDLEGQRIKMKRAYQVVFKQIKLGQVNSTRQALEEQVDRLMGMDDAAFSGFADAIEHSNTPKPTKEDIVNVEASNDNQSMTRSAGYFPGLGREAAEESFAGALSEIDWS